MVNNYVKSFRTISGSATDNLRTLVVGRPTIVPFDEHSEAQLQAVRNFCVSAYARGERVAVYRSVAGLDVPAVGQCSW